MFAPVMNAHSEKTIGSSVSLQFSSTQHSVRAFPQTMLRSSIKRIERCISDAIDALEDWCCDLFKDGIKSQFDGISDLLTFENQNRSKDKLIKTIQIPEQDDDFNDIRSEYSKMLTDKLMTGSNGQSARKFLTFGIESTSYKSARSKPYSKSK